jgi:hypothetical protein
MPTKAPQKKIAASKSKEERGEPKRSAKAEKREEKTESRKKK